MKEKLVIDSGIAIKRFVEEPDSAAASTILSDYEKGDFDFLSPDLIYSEVGNIFWKKVMFQGFEIANAKYAIENFRKIPITTVSSHSLFDQAFAIATKHKRTFYDSLYLALSEKEDCKFVTADERLYNSVRYNFRKIAPLSTWQG